MRSVTEHRSDSEAPESPTAGGCEVLLPYPTHCRCRRGTRPKEKENQNEKSVIFAAIPEMEGDMTTHLRMGDVPALTLVFRHGGFDFQTLNFIGL